ncbi:MAG TPA: guanine deaminase, partial [Thermoanaerobaculia bacterium]|nr:guanine deaminase [Thermoanaerobaculia bacterium]
MQVYRARVFTPVADPFANGIESSYQYWASGFLAVDDAGRIHSVGDSSEKPEGTVIDLGEDALITPGFIDTHLHAPQLEMIGSYGGHLL